MYDTYLKEKAIKLQENGACLFEHNNYLYIFYETDSMWAYDQYEALLIGSGEAVDPLDGGVYEGTAYEAILFAIKDDDV